MIIVTGTPRSGTSMWMRILVAAGLPHIGEKFPANWAELLAEANSDGFYESVFVGGIYYRTNPSPETGVFLFPEQTETHAVKVFVPGLLRTDYAFIDRVIGTVRDWREYASSVRRLRRMAHGGEVHVPEAQLPPHLEWWNDNFGLIRDLVVRRYAAHVVSYQALLDDPEREVRVALDWLGIGDADAAIGVVDEKKRSQRDPDPPDGVDPDDAEVFDELYDHVHRGLELSPAFIERLNQTDARLRPQILEREAAFRLRAARAIAQPRTRELRP